MAEAEPRVTPGFRHAELVSASIVPHVEVLQNLTATAACSFNASAQSNGWTLKQVQGDDDFEVVR